MQKIDKNQILSIVGVIVFIGLGVFLLKDSKPPVKQLPVAQNGTFEPFDKCLDSGKYDLAVSSSTTIGSNAGVNSTPKAFILKNGKVVDTIDGAIPTGDVKQKIDQALAANGNAGVMNPNLPPVSADDFTMGDEGAPVTVIEYADFQCPFCGRFFRDSEKTVIETYVQQGKIKFIYRDFAFLGEESGWAAQAAMCAAEQGKFWEYHDYLYNHQNGENQGAFSIINLKSFAKTLGLE